MITHLWHAAIHEFLSFHRAAGSPASTLATRREHLQLAASALGGDPWATTGAALVAWFGTLQVAQNTRRSRRTTLRAFYRWGVDTGHATVNAALALPVVAAGPPRPNPVPDHAYRLALLAASEREGLMLRLSAELGLRRAEVACVHSRDVVQDLDGWSLVVLGKGNRERVMPMPARLAQDLRNLPSGYAFPGDAAGHLSPRWVGTIIGRLLPEGWTMHKLRHRFATRAYLVDRDVFTVQELLGHASPATTRAYVAIPNHFLRRTVEAAA